MISSNIFSVRPERSGEGDLSSSLSVVMPLEVGLGTLKLCLLLTETKTKPCFSACRAEGGSEDFVSSSSGSSTSPHGVVFGLETFVGGVLPLLLPEQLSPSMAECSFSGVLLLLNCRSLSSTASDMRMPSGGEGLSSTEEDLSAAEADRAVSSAEEDLSTAEVVSSAEEDLSTAEVVSSAEED